MLPSNVDIATQEILTLAEQYDKIGERTLGVPTKPDLVIERSPQISVCNLVVGKKNKLRLGYYAVRNRGADEDAFDRCEDMLEEEPWNTLPKNRVGVQALKARLGELLNEITRRGSPELRIEISRMLETSQKELDGLGAARQTEREHRVFLSNIARQFQELVHTALDTNYSSHAVFENKDELTLITQVVYLSDLFRQFQQKAHLRHFESVVASTPFDNGEGDGRDGEGDDDKTWIDANAATKGVCFARHACYGFP